jgi:hypothetical protein
MAAVPPCVCLCGIGRLASVGVAHCARSSPVSIGTTREVVIPMAATPRICALADPALCAYSSYIAGTALALFAVAEPQLLAYYL